MRWCRVSARGWWNGSGAALPSAAPTLTRLYSLHYLFPFVIAGVVVLHIWALHIPGNNNPTGIDVKSPRETIPFHPYYTIKDGFALALFALFFACFVFYAPNFLGHPDNYIPANPLQTPAHIVPEWYFLPFYAILRAIPSKLFGVAALIGSIAILFFVPWLDTSRVRSTSYRPIYKWFFWAFVVTCIALGYLGSQPPEGVYLVLGRIFTAYYFLFFLVVMPVVGWIEKPKGLPGSITESVLGPRGNAGRRQQSPRRNAARRSRWHDHVVAIRPCAHCGLCRCFRSMRCGAALAEDAKPAAEPVSHEPADSTRRNGASPGRSAPFDNAQLQRGYHVYKQICSNCHSMRLLSYRNLGEPGGPEFSPEAVDDARLRGAGNRRAERQGRDVPAPGTSVRPLPLAFRQRCSGARRPTVARCLRISR